MLLLLISGCSGNNTNSDSNANAGSNANNEEAYSPGIPEDEQGTITLDTQNGDMNISGMNERPPGFPEEIPLPEGAVITASMEQPEINSSMLVFEVKLPLEDAIQLYMDYVTANGYIEQMPITQDEEAFWFAGSKDTEQLVIILGKDHERDGWIGGTLTYRNGTE